MKSIYKTFYTDELIRRWAAQGLLTVMKPSVQETMGEDTDGYHCQYYGDDNIWPCLVCGWCKRKFFFDEILLI